MKGLEFHIWKPPSVYVTSPVVHIAYCLTQADVTKSGVIAGEPQSQQQTAWDGLTVSKLYCREKEDYAITRSTGRVITSSTAGRRSLDYAITLSTGRVITCSTAGRRRITPLVTLQVESSTALQVVITLSTGGVIIRSTSSHHPLYRWSHHPL